MKKKIKKKIKKYIKKDINKLVKKMILISCIVSISISCIVLLIINDTCRALPYVAIFAGIGWILGIIRIGMDYLKY